MNRLQVVDNFEEIAINSYPLIDSRSPGEFEKGSFPNAKNLPLMTNEERKLVGTAYKEQGQEVAIELGHQLVSGDTKKIRVQKWIEFIKAHPNTHLFCWRGGLRSQIVQEWIYEESGIVVPRLKGGYKAFRNYLIDRSVELAKEKDIIILGGRTGSGKTLMLKEIPHSIDLERLAIHRGSAFGRYATAQPSQIDFENALAYEQIKHNAKGFQSLVIEDESRNIGQRYIPLEIFEAFQQGSVVIVNIPLRERVDIIFDDYVTYSQKEYDEAYEKGLSEYNWHDTMLHNFSRIRKRLGGDRYKKFLDIFQSAWEYQLKTNDASRHKEWIETLLIEYYDPMYDYQIEKKRDRVIFEGSRDEVVEYLKNRESRE